MTRNHNNRHGNPVGPYILVAWYSPTFSERSEELLDQLFADIHLLTTLCDRKPVDSEAVAGKWQFTVAISLNPRISTANETFFKVSTLSLSIKHFEQFGSIQGRNYCFKIAVRNWSAFPIFPISKQNPQHVAES